MLYVIIFSHFLLLCLFTFIPYDELLLYPYLTNSGLVPYLQIYDQHFPGVLMLPVNLATIGFDTYSELKILHFVLLGLNHFLIYKIILKFGIGRQKAFLLNLFYLVWQIFYEGNVLWIESFIVPLLLASFYFNQINKPKSLFFSGLFLGMALLNKQVLLPLTAAIVVYNYIFNRKKVSYFLLGLGLPVLYLFHFLYTKEIVNKFIYWTFTFNSEVYSKMALAQPKIREIIRSILFPAVIVTYYIFKKSVLVRSNLFLIIYLLGSIIFVFGRYDPVHFQVLIAFTTIAAALVFRRKIIIIFIFLGLILTVRHSLVYNLIGYENLKEEQYQISTYIKNNNIEDIFIYSYPVNYYFSGKLPPGDRFVYLSPWYLKVVDDEFLKILAEEKPEYVLIQKNIESRNRLTEYVEQNYIEFYSSANMELRKLVK